MNKKNFDGVLFLIAGALYFVAAVLYKNYINIALGCCFIFLGISKRSKRKIMYKQLDLMNNLNLF